MDVTIWKPIIGKNITTIRKPRAEIAISSSSEVNIETTFSGISIPIRKPEVVNIGRQLGSGGKEIGEKLAARLGIDFYDKELITLASI